MTPAEYEKQMQEFGDALVPIIDFFQAEQAKEEGALQYRLLCCNILSDVALLVNKLTQVALLKKFSCGGTEE